ncbi:hypothetical protein KGF56_001685 [Candida oxycetoniae]|uniref:Uncharacterized protein n=1 Tax=Candida oxycetoniae TaxID=497107 RepID=A0AAI9SZ43_9ASCO|nr:uncharacterized protein KGF56_001685 [Candida oxycetoniae]KAI3405667.1 hypothetical protein KGF56_001685 [Candida oxycetoniae]
MRVHLFRLVVIFRVLALVFANLPSHNPLKEEIPIFKITAKTHDRNTISDFLQQVANKITNSPTNLSKFKAWSTSSNNGASLNNDAEKQCLEDSSIKYYIRSLTLTDQIYDASECRINMNPRMQSIIQPTYNVHNLILRENDTIQTQLKYVLVDEFNRYEQFKDYKFNDFENLNYDITCLIDYQQLMQVEFRETLIEVGLERRVEIDNSCEFNKLNLQFTGTAIDYVTSHVPLNGTFFCRKGRSSTCNRSIAESKNARYKLPD